MHIVFLGLAWDERSCDRVVWFRVRCSEITHFLGLILDSIFFVSSVRLSIRENEYKPYVWRLNFDSEFLYQLHFRIVAGRANCSTRRDCPRWFVTVQFDLNFERFNLTLKFLDHDPEDFEVWDTGKDEMGSAHYVDVGCVTSNLPLAHSLTSLSTGIVR